MFNFFSILSSTRNMIYLTIFLVPLYLVRFHIFHVPTNAWEVLMGATYLIWFINSFKLGERRQYLKLRKYVLPISLILSGLIFSAVFNENSAQSWGIIKSWFLIPIIFSWVIFSAVETKKDVENILKAMYFSAVAVSIISLLYYFLGELTYDGRLKAFYQSPNYLAMYLAPNTLIGLYLIGKKNYSKVKKLLMIASFVLLLAPFYLTFSYAAWLSVTVAFLFVNMAKINKTNFKKLGILAAILVLIFYFQLNSSKFQDIVNFNERSSLSSRIMIWKSAEKILFDNAIWGVGPGNFQEEYLEYQKYFPPYLEWAVPHPHNLYLAFWLQSGLLGIIGFMWLMVVWLKDIMIKTKNSTYDKTSAVLLGVMIYVLIHGLVDTTYWKNDLSVVFWVIFALGIISKK